MIRSRTNEGFTLLELLVAISVTALVSVLVMGALSFQGRAWSRVNTAADGLDEIYGAQTTLRRLVAGIEAEPGEEKLEGTQSGLAFATLFAFPGEAPRKTIAELRAEPCAARTCLVLVLTPLDATGEPLTAPIRETLVRGVDGFEIAYFSRGAGWQPAWRPEAGVPGLIRIAIEFPARDKRRWPALYLAAGEPGT